MMGFLKPLADAEKLAKEQREVAKFNAARAVKHVADAEARSAWKRELNDFSPVGGTRLGKKRFILFRIK